MNFSNLFITDTRGMLLSSTDSIDDDQEEDNVRAQGSVNLSETSDFASLAPSNELRELCHLQLTMLITSLESRLGATVSETAVRCAVYRRNPGSLPSGQMQLQLVAASDVREAEASNHRRDLILGIPSNNEANEEYQEAWLVDQSLIVLPDSGGLVLPLSHNSFLVGLLVVECCDTQDTIISNLHPPVCAVFSPADMALIRKVGASLALACALDLRAALERAGHAVRRQQVQGLVRQARKPLTTLRTLGAMLAPRLQEGEPERDLTNNIVAQGQRLGDIVSQLQAYLAPPVPTVKIGGPFVNNSTALMMGDGGESSIPTSSSSSSSGTVAPLSNRQHPPTIVLGVGNQIKSTSSKSNTVTVAQGSPSSMDSGTVNNTQTRGAHGGTSGNHTNEVSLSPALPSSTIGSDFSGMLATNVALDSSTTIVTTTTAGSSDRIPAAMDIDVATTAAVKTRLIATLAPLLRSAENFAAVSGVTFLFPYVSSSSPSSSPPPSFSSDSIRLSTPEMFIPCDQIVLKRLLSQLLDGIIACAARGDCIEFSIDGNQLLRGTTGVNITARLVHAIGPGTLTRTPPVALIDKSADGHVFIAEFATLSRSTQAAGGWFDVTIDHEPASVVTATMWLPIITVN